MLTIEQASVRFGALVAVDRVDLQVPDGQVLALLGPSGCGKSTLLRAVAGLEPLVSGRIAWDGTDLARVPVHRRGFGLMFQDGVLFPHRSVAGNVGYGLAGRGLDRPTTAARVGEMLDLVGLTGFGPRRVDTLSGGQAQRVALGRALAPSPRLLLLDEPLAALDASLRTRLLDDLRAVLTRTATTALFVTHDQSEAFAVADRVAVMSAGRIRQTGTPTELWAHPVDDWVAEFVGYQSVVEGAALPAGPGGAPSGRVALRATALVLDPAGRLSGRCLASWPTPDGVRLRVEVAGLGEVLAVADGERWPQPGELVRLRYEPARAAVLPPAPWQAGPS